MTNISLSIIIVNYNTFKLTRDTINSCISEPTRYTYEIFLVDNKSTDDSLFQLKEYFKKEISRGTIKVIENEENKGFANANNLAIEKSQGDFVLLLNSDTLVEQNTMLEHWDARSPWQMEVLTRHASAVFQILQTLFINCSISIQVHPKQITISQDWMTMEFMK